MRLIDLTVERLGGCFTYEQSVEAKFLLDKDEFKLINENSLNIIYSLGVGEKITMEKNNMNKNKTKIIFNKPLTILYVNGKRYISKAHEEEFDEEKGLLMCLAKANGISHLELKRMIKNAQRQTPKV